MMDLFLPVTYKKIMYWDYVISMSLSLIISLNMYQKHFPKV